jgi:signal transduction histidine kinase
VFRLPKGERLDRLVAGVLVVQGQLEVWLASTPGPKWLVAPATLAAALSIALRRRWPVGTLGFLSGLTVVMFLGLDPHPNTLAAAVSYFCALYGVAVWTDARHFVMGCAVLIGASAVTALAPGANYRSTILFTAVSGIAVFLTRGAVRGRDLLAEAHAARAELLEGQQELRAHAAVAEERARIARELHDLVAHNVSVMVVQAGAERHALGAEQASTRETLTSIEQAGRQALGETRRLLGMLRPDEHGRELEPQPGVEQIDVLVSQVERAGLSVALEMEGDPVALPAGVDLCAYRIVQEGLTNALKHAGSARAEVLLRYAPRSLEIVVRDDGRGPVASNGDGGGHGLIGMRERVALYRGRLETGPRAGGGFEVHAHLPLP